jgi:hypothetical protein
MISKTGEKLTEKVRDLVLGQLGAPKAAFLNWRGDFFTSFATLPV